MVIIIEVCERSEMAPKGFRSVTLPKDVVDEVEKFVQVHGDKLKLIGIKKINHVFERAWYHYKEYVTKRLDDLGP